MRIRPNENYMLFGTNIKLDKTRTYEALVGTNLPHWRERGFVYVNGVLLERSEYEIISC